MTFGDRPIRTDAVWYTHRKSHPPSFDALLYQTLRAGEFHADPHPGNIVVAPDGAIVLIDWGSAGRVPPERLPSLRQFFLAFVSGQGEMVRDAIRAFVPEVSEASLDTVTQTLAQADLDYREKFTRTLVAISEGGRAIDEGFEKYLKALATGAHLSRGIPQESLLPSMLTYVQPTE